MSVNYSVNQFLEKCFKNNVFIIIIIKEIGTACYK